MSKLADYNTPESRLTVFAEELKEIAKTSKLTPEIIDIVMEPYTTMIDHYGLLTFEREEELVDRVLFELDREKNGFGYTTKDIAERFDAEGIDYIFDHEVLL